MGESTGARSQQCVINVRNATWLLMRRHRMSYLKIVRRTDYCSHIWSGPNTAAIFGSTGRNVAATFSVPPCDTMSAPGPNISAIFGPGPNVAATFGPVWEGKLSPSAKCLPGHSALGQDVSRYFNLSYEISACIISTNIHHPLRNLNAECASIAFNEHFKNECFDDDGKESSHVYRRQRAHVHCHCAIWYLKIPRFYTLQVHIRTV